MNGFEVATFNVHYICKGDGCKNAEKVAVTITECGADVVCLQESNGSWEDFLMYGKHSLQLQSLYPHIRFHNHSHPWGGFAVLSKYAFEDWQVLREVDKWWYPAGLVTLRVPKQAGQLNEDHHLLQLLIVHLRAPVKISEKPYFWGGHANWVGGLMSQQVKDRRLYEIQTFASFLQPDLPSIVLGDFNERGSSSRCVQYLEEELGMTNLAKKSVAGCFSTKNSWSLDVGGVTLLSLDYDHIVYSPRYLRAIDQVALVHKDGGSDHRLVSAKFKLMEK